MALSKETYIRYKIIDACIKNEQNPYPSMEFIIETCREKLGKDFSVSTIQKDIKAMKEDELLGFLAPIKYSKSYNGYYYSGDYDFGQIPLTDNEIESLRAAGEIFNSFSGSRVSESLNLALSKIMASFSENFDKRENQIPIVFTENPPKQRGWEFFDFFLNVVKNKIAVSIVHYSYKKNLFSSTVLHPYQLLEFNNYWYILGFSEKYQAVRTYGFDRIYEPVELDIPFNDTKMDEVSKYNNDMYGVLPLSDHKKQKIVFRCSSFLSKYLTAHPLHKSQEVVDYTDYGSKKFSVELIPTFELVRWFFSNSMDVIVEKNIAVIQELTRMFKESKLNK